MNKKAIFLLSMLIIAACSGNKSKEDESVTDKADYVSEKNMVDTMVLKRVNFNKQIISNGKLKAITKSDLKFLTSGTISEILVKNGESIKAGTAIARLDQKDAKYKLEQARLSMSKAELEFYDQLIGYGYSKDTSAVPSDLLKTIKIRSGYTSAKGDLRQAEEALGNTTLYAPFSGKVANLSAKPHEAFSDIVCTLIDDTRFEVEFGLLESEVPFVKVGSSIKINTYSDPEKFYSGSVTQINPLVNEKGQIKVLAMVNNSSGKLIEGMNTKVIVEDLIRGKLVVPKSAVVMRDDFDVLFRLDKKTNKAMWTYVTIEMSNTESHAVTANIDKNAELNEGDIIITSGNLNLADGSNVEIKKQKR